MMLIIFKCLLKILKSKWQNIKFFIKSKYEKIKSYVEYEDKINISKISYEDLAPKDDIDKDGVYSKALDWALKNEKILNIALTGAYGSGKSSILRTYEKNRLNNNYLNISLASFKNNCDGCKYKEVEDDNCQNEKCHKLDEIEIEKGILQQLFYRIKSKKIPYSRFRKIKNFSTGFLLWKVMLPLITIVDGVLIFSPKTIFSLKNNITILRNFKFSEVHIIGLYFIFLIFSLIIVIDFLRYISKGVRINKINLEKAEIELEKVNDESIFNRYLDEILYFFEVTNYNIVFIEDLDRFNDISIFTKLRELNSLINNSEQIKKKVVFIYAIKDDMFANKDRTKFFDFIIPVIPVINSSNSGEILYEKIKKDNLEEEVSEGFINDITIYIDDMRILNNIYNEFLLYKQTLCDVSLKLEKLLAIIVYKNVYPDDFAKLQYNQGLVYLAFERKSKIKLKMINEIQEKCINLEKEIDFIEKEHLNNIRELKLALIYRLSNWRGDISTIRIDNINNRHINDILANDSDLSIFNGNKFWINFINSSTGITKTMEEINKQNGSEKSFYERVQVIRLNKKSKIEDIKQELSNLRKREILIKSWSLYEIIQEVGLESFFDELNNERKLIIFLLRNGYINEMYPSYITYFYPGNLTQEDMNFIMNIKDQEALEPTYKLTKIDKIIDRLNRNEFERVEVLNYNLIDFIFENNDKYYEYLKIIIEQLSNESNESITFIDSFKDITKHKELFIKSLCKSWSNIWYYIENKSNYSISKKYEYLIDIIMFSDVEDIVKINKELILTKYISKDADFVNLMSSKENIGKIQNVIAELDVKFQKINEPLNSNNELLEFIIENSLYIINKDMIECIIQFKFPDRLQDANRCNYTTIQRINYLPLVKYIDDNFQSYIDNVFFQLENNDSEEEKIIIKLLQKENRSKELRYKIIEKENVTFNDIASIEKELWGKVINDCKIKPFWSNLMNYYALSNSIDQILVSYLTKLDNYEILSLSKCNSNGKLDEEIYKSFSKELILCENISEEVFKKLAQSVPYKYIKFDTSSISDIRVQNIICCNLLNFTIENYNELRQNHKKELIFFIERNIDLFLKELDAYEIDNNDLNYIMNSNSITDNQRATLVSNLHKGIICDDRNLAESIINLILAYSESTKINEELIEEIFATKLSQDKKVSLLNTQIKYLEYDHVTKYLLILGTPYDNITINKRKPLIDNTDENLELVSNLKASNYIASFKEEKNGLRVYTKNK